MHIHTREKDIEDDAAAPNVALLAVAPTLDYLWRQVRGRAAHRLHVFHLVYVHVCAHTCVHMCVYCWHHARHDDLAQTLDPKP